MTPYYNKPPQRGIVAHFEAIARASDRPIVVYNIPSRVVVNIEPETISRLAEIETVRAVKQANDDLDAGTAHRRHRASTCTRATTTSSSRSSSSAASGGVCVHTHVVGPQVAEQVAGGARRRRRAGARDRRGARARSTTCSKVQTNPIAIKAALRLLGHRVGGHRLPLVDADRGRGRAVRGCLERLGLLVARLAAPPTLGPRWHDVLRVIPLGGLGEVGKNMTVYELGGERIVVDAGMSFPRDEHLGVDVILPGLRLPPRRARSAPSC